jgi:hypothetical protein
VSTRQARMRARILARTGSEREPSRGLFVAHPSFTRGMTLGLLVGAAIAGSVIRERLRRRGGAAEGPEALAGRATTPPGRTDPA